MRCDPSANAEAGPYAVIGPFRVYNLARGAGLDQGFPGGVPHTEVIAFRCRARVQDVTTSVQAHAIKPPSVRYLFSIVGYHFIIVSSGG
jgi:hypothetical protein